MVDLLKKVLAKRELNAIAMKHWQSLEHNFFGQDCYYFATIFLDRSGSIQIENGENLLNWNLDVVKFPEMNQEILDDIIQEMGHDKVVLALTPLFGKVIDNSSDSW